MEISWHDRRAVLRLVLTASLASLSYELALMRIFSISLWYHFAFMVISIAMLGIGASGTVLSVFPGLKDLRRVPLYGLLLAISIPVSYLLANAVPFDPARLSWDRLQLLAIGLYYVILCVPFFCFGLIVSTAYSTMSRDANAIYASDLLGAGVGALAMVWLLSLGGPETSVFIISALLATGLLSHRDGKCGSFPCSSSRESCRPLHRSAIYPAQDIALQALCARHAVPRRGAPQHRVQPLRARRPVQKPGSQVRAGPELYVP